MDPPVRAISTSLWLACLACAHPAEGKPGPAQDKPAAPAAPGSRIPGGSPSATPPTPPAAPPAGALRFLAIGGG
ncbi:MAG TPA: hypothetical protein VJU61_23345, partial [Polyangiaceae bacterium]|nr:hypothetical protein [Polyangiaceae bacterium]